MLVGKFQVGQREKKTFRIVECCERHDEATLCFSDVAYRNHYLYISTEYVQTSDIDLKK